MKCEICNKEINNSKGLSVHLRKSHNFNVIDKKNYYDKYYKKENEGKCYFCNNESKFFDISRGYHKICESKKCLGKTRATGTFEFLMYKYNLSETDAIELMNKRAKERGIKITEGLQNSFEKNENFFQEKSRQNIKFWLKKGYSQEESEIKVKEVWNDIHEKTWNKRRNNPDLYKDVNTTQIDYWLKKGFTSEESIKKIKERQNTFTLKKCIDKYGDKKGLEVWNDRQIKWSNKIETKYKNGDFTRFRNDNYSGPELKMFDSIVEKLNLKDKNVYYGKKQFYRHFNEIGKTFSYDFVYKKKIIEFNGDYWHCNPKMYNSNYYHKYLQMFAHEIWEREKIKINSIKDIGYEVLIIWESDYKNNKEETVQKCIEFLNNKKNNKNQC